MGTRIRVVALAVGLSSAVALLPGAIQAQPSVAGNDYFAVQESRGVPTVSIGGTVIPYKEVTLAAQLPGRIKFLAGIEGDAFKDGDVLVSIDEAELLAKRRAATAQLASADAQLRNAGVQYNFRFVPH